MSQSKVVRVTEFSALMSKNDLQSLAGQFDLLKILLLDISKEDMFLSFDPELSDDYQEYSNSMELNDRTVGFATEKENIELLIADPERIYCSIFSENELSKLVLEIDEPIYIYQNQAIIEISSRTTSDLYYLRLNEGIVQINWLGGTVE